MSVPAGNRTTNGTTNGPAPDQRSTTNLGDGHIMGNLTADPELRYTPSGRAVVTLRAAYTARVQNRDTGAWQDSEPEFYTIQAWGQQAENAAECLQRGDRIVAAGTWQREEYAKRDGTPGEAIRLVARDLGASMLFRQVHITRTSRRGQAATSTRPQSVARPAGQRATSTEDQAHDDPWAGEHTEPADDGSGDA